MLLLLEYLFNHEHCNTDKRSTYFAILQGYIIFETVLYIVKMKAMTMFS